MWIRFQSYFLISFNCDFSIRNNILWKFFHKYKITLIISEKIINHLEKLRKTFYKNFWNCVKQRNNQQKTQLKTKVKLMFKLLSCFLNPLEPDSDSCFSDGLRWEMLSICSYNSEHKCKSCLYYSSIFLCPKRNFVERVIFFWLQTEHIQLFNEIH